ncbi:MAG: copper resistance protein CopC [Oceanicaulis sp.]|nr:copper resistance protein CopC [Oceanicaulis sp.]
MPLIRLAAAGVIAISMAAAAFAHTVMTHSNIRDGDVLAEAPPSFEFGFADPVSLVGLALVDAEADDAIDIGFERVRGMQEAFSVPLPALGEGNYVIRWRAVAQDGHVMRGEISFQLSADAEPHSQDGNGHSGHAEHHAEHHGHDHGHDHAGHEDLVGLIRSTPSDGATVESGIDRIELHFDHPMAVRSIQLFTLALERIPVQFEAQEDPVTSIEAAMEPLDPGEYELNWRADGGDHEMSGSIRFTVE